LSEITTFCHSREGDNPVNSNTYGCRIKSGMTAEGLFTGLSKLVIELPKIIRNRFGIVFEIMSKTFLPMQAKQAKQNGFVLR
jgi:hypothetical protein